MSGGKRLRFPNWQKCFIWSVIIIPAFAGFVFGLSAVVLTAVSYSPTTALSMALFMIFAGIFGGPIFALPGSLIGFTLITLWRLKRPHGVFTVLICVTIASCLTWMPLQEWANAWCNIQGGNCRTNHMDGFSRAVEATGYTLALTLSIAITVCVFRKRLKLDDLFGQ